MKHWHQQTRERLADLIKQGGGNQSEFARKHGFGVTYINDVLQYRKPPTPGMAEICGVSRPAPAICGYRTWDADAIAQLRLLWAEKLPSVEIARTMGFTKNAILGKVHRLNLDGRASPIKTGGRAPRSRKPRAGKVTLPKLVATPIVVDPADPPVVFKPRVYRHTDCVWPTGEGRNIRFECDAPAMPGRPYCAAHCRRAYTPAGSVTAGDAQAAAL